MITGVLASLPILVLAYLFAAFGFLLAHASIVIPALVAAWLVLLVPTRVWQSIGTTLSTSVAAVQNRLSEARPRMAAQSR